MSGAIKAYDSTLHQSNQGPGVHRQSGGDGAPGAMTLAYTSMGPSAPRWLSLKFTAVLLNFSVLPTQGLSPGRKGLLPSPGDEVSTDPSSGGKKLQTDRSHRYGEALRVGGGAGEMNEWGGEGFQSGLWGDMTQG